MTLREWLRANGLSHNDFAARSGVPQTTIARVCLGHGASLKNSISIVIGTGGEVSLIDLIPGGRGDGEDEAAREDPHNGDVSPENGEGDR